MEKQYVQKKAKASQLSKAIENKDIKKSPDKSPASLAGNSTSASSSPSQSSPAPQSATPASSSQPSSSQTSPSAPTEKTEEKEKKPKEAVKVKKEEAIAKGLNLHASKKHCMYICSFIKNKSIDWAILELQKVIQLKRPIPFKGEIPHRSYPGMMSGRYPVSASKQFINILKALKGNVIANGMELEKTRIYFGSANWASRPQKRGGARFKRTHVLLKAKEFNSENKAQMKTQKSEKTEIKSEAEK
ncbi:MAG: hypothetical protein AABX07_02075 [Nanoarchaeota archaeon]